MDEILIHSGWMFGFIGGQLIMEGIRDKNGKIIIWGIWVIVLACLTDAGVMSI